MCIRDSYEAACRAHELPAYCRVADLTTESVKSVTLELLTACLLYTSDAADELLCVDLGGRRIIKKKTHR